MIEIHFEPTLFVFLGASSGQVGWRLKQALHHAYGPLPILRFLWVDAGPTVSAEAAPWLTEDERSDAGPALGDKLRAAIEALQRSENLGATEGLSSDPLRLIVERPEGEMSARVYIVFSVGGREESAASFEVAYLCRHLLGEIRHTIIGVSLLPSVGERAIADEAQRERLRANAYAWFKEHESLLHNPSWDVQCPGGERVRLEVPPFDLTFVVDLGNQAGEQLASPDEVYAMVVQALFLCAGAPASAARPALEDKASVLRSRFRDRFRAYSSLAAASLVYPQEKVLGYCRAALAGAMLSDGLLAEPVAGQAQAAVGEFLARTALSAEAILKAPLEGRQMPEGKALAMGEATTVQAILSLAQAQEGRDAQALQEQELKMDKAAAELQSRAVAALEPEMASLVINRGLPLARAILGLLRTEILRYAQNDICNALGTSLDEAKGNRQAAQGRLSKLDQGFRQALRKALTPKAWKHDLAEARDELLHWVGEISRLTLALAAQRKAGALGDQLSARVGELDGRLASVQQTLERAQETLKRVAEGNLGEPVAAQGVFQLSAEALSPGYIRRYYGERVQALSTLLAYRGWAASFAGKTLPDLEAWKETDLTQQFQERASVHFAQELENVSLLGAMDTYYGMQSPAMIEIQFGDLLGRCQPFWRYDQDSGIRPYEGKSILGAEDAGSSLLPSRYRGSREHVLASTGSKQRIDAARTQHGLPAFLLRGMEEYKACYDKLRKEGGDLPHALPAERLAVDVFPERDIEARETFALAAALGYIVQVAGWHYFDPQREYIRDHLRPSRDCLLDQRRDWAEAAFVLRVDWVQQAKRLVGGELASLGQEEAIKLLDERIAQCQELSREMPDELQRQYERGIRALEEKKARLLGE